MRGRGVVGSLLTLVLGLAVQGVGSVAVAQTTEIKTEYLMTYMVPLDAFPIDNSLIIFNAKSAGSWAKGPNINGTFLEPSGDWLRIMPSGVFRLDVRGTLKTDDGALIFISYNGIIQHTAESAERMNKGELLTTKDIPYFITTPTFQTSHPKYAWLNNVQAVNKIVEVRIGEGAYVKYDVFILR